MSPSTPELLENYSEKLWSEWRDSQKDFEISLELAGQLAEIGDYDSAQEVYRRADKSSDRIIKGLVCTGLAKAYIGLGRSQPASLEKVINHADYALLALNQAFAHLMKARGIPPEVIYEKKSLASAE